MVILRPSILPDLSPPVRAGRKNRNLLNQDFYKDSSSPINRNFVKESFNSQPIQSGQYIQQNLERLRSKQPVPELQPIDRVRSPSSELVQPSNFQSFYDRINNISSRNQPTSNINTNINNNSFNPSISSSNSNFNYAKEIAPSLGWGPSELNAWYKLGMKESGWRNNAQNPTSTAYGIGQFLDSTWRTVGGVKTSDPRSQVIYMAKYIQARYGSPSRALAFHINNNWY